MDTVDILAALDAEDKFGKTFKIVVFKYYSGSHATLFKQNDKFNLIKHSISTNKTEQVKKNVVSLGEIFSFIEKDPELVSKVLVYEKIENTSSLILMSKRRKGTNIHRAMDINYT